ncbi:MAG TPA: glycerophosphodiester phosphodiesterase family protein [Pirellulales bacterium]
MRSTSPQSLDSPDKHPATNSGVPWNRKAIMSDLSLTRPSSTLPLRAATTAAFGKFQRAWRRIVVFQIGYHLLASLVLGPLAVGMLSLVMQRTGYSAIGNEDILAFLLSPIGVGYAALFATTLFGSLLAESAGVTALVAWQRTGDARASLSWTAGASLVAYYAALLVKLGSLLVIAATVLAIPFVAVAAGVYFLLLGQHDVNFYLYTKPPVFWVAAGIGGALAALYGIAAIAVGVRWSLALPIVLFERRSVIDSLHESWRRTQAFALRLGAALVGWHLAAFALGALGTLLFRMLAETALDATGERLSVTVPLVAALLVFQAVLVAVPSAIGVTGHSLLVFAYYSADEPRPATLPSPTDLPEPKRWFNRPRQLAVATIALLAGMLAVLSQIDVAWPRVEVTSHRGHGTNSPENTLAGIREAIAAHADFVEIDVQATRDGEVILLHDRDFMRVAGEAVRPGDLTLEEIRRFDVGGGFDGRFTGERIPTLDEVIELTQGKIRVNIEMKSYDDPKPLAEHTVRVIERRGFVGECIVTSLTYAGLQEVKRRNPAIKTGLIVGIALGDVSRLDVDLLSVRSSLITRRFLYEARRERKDVHAWTVNSPALASRLMALGVENLITGQPLLIVPLRDEWEQLSDVERLLIAARYLIAGRNLSAAPR